MSALTQLSESTQTVRTTLTFVAEDFEFLKTYAKAKAMRLSEAMADLIGQVRNKNQGGMIQKNDLWVIDSPSLRKGYKGSKMTMEQVNQLRDQEY
jgi:thiamine monophosphate kinase